VPAQCRPLRSSTDRFALSGASQGFERRIGRYPTTPAELLIEMNAEATDYAIVADRDLDPAAFAPVLDTLRTLLAAEPAPLTRHEILAGWPSPATRPTPNTLWRWLCRACELGVLARHGEGSKTDAFRYGVAASGEQAGEGAT
jgi:hypothetical protein